VLKRWKKNPKDNNPKDNDPKDNDGQGMNIERYQDYLQQYVQEAIQNSSGSNAAIYEYLEGIKPAGRFSAHREEKRRALKDAQVAFSEHRHWPLEIVLSHLGVEMPDGEGN